MNRLFYILATLLVFSCAESVVEDVEVGPYTVSVIYKNVYHIQDYNSEYPAGVVLDAEGNFVGFSICVT